ncbi:alkaline/neutral invertase cinv2 [Phtheirospermum japonicum]|uniref:Alkaline/neutral invertase cinv2 n=1 Tax=Phtheirospermum japonicum TaxID=374723 RepID=A0A830BEL5_9LAMI|nr:alkaline/neutral invertase cinv2 [Phtheirospermum japonicum]
MITVVFLYTYHLYFAASLNNTPTPKHKPPPQINHRPKRHRSHLLELLQPPTSANLSLSHHHSKTSIAVTSHGSVVTLIDEEGMGLAEDVGTLEFLSTYAQSFPLKHIVTTAESGLQALEFLRLVDDKQNSGEGARVMWGYVNRILSQLSLIRESSMANFSWSGVGSRAASKLRSYSTVAGAAGTAASAQKSKSGCKKE